MGPHAEDTSAGNIGQCAVTPKFSAHTDQTLTLTMKRQNTFAMTKGIEYYKSARRSPTPVR